MARQAKNESKRVNIIMSGPLVDELDEYALAKGMSRSALMAYYCSKGLQQDKAMDFIGKIPQEKLAEILKESSE